MNRNRIFSAFISLILCVLMIFSMTSCGKKKAEEAPKADIVADEIEYRKIKPDEFLEKAVKDQTKVTEEEYAAIVSTLTYAKINDKLELDDNVTIRALQTLTVNKAELPDTKSLIDSLIENDSAQIRGFAVGLCRTSVDGTAECPESVRKLLKNEKEPYVLKCAIDAFSDSGASDEEIGKFLVEMSENENPVLRLHAVYALGNTSSIGVEGAAEAVITCMDDEDADVRKAAYKFCGQLHDDKVIEPVVKMLNDEKQAEYHEYGLLGLIDMWYNYPSYKYTSEAAYKATMDYFKKSKNPPQTALIALTAKGEGYDGWKEKAKYFNVSELCEIMSSIVKNPDIKWISRVSAAKIVSLHGTKADIDAVKKLIDGLDDANAEVIKNQKKVIFK